MQRHFLKKAAWAVSLASAGLAGLVAPSFADVAQGVFVGSAKGIGGDVTVTITVKNGKLAEVEADTGSETPGYGHDIGRVMAERILAAGLSKVDGVSGATVTSDAVRAAAESALREAGLSKATETKARVGRWVGTAHGAKSELTAEIVVDDAGHSRIEKVASGDTPYVKDFTVQAAQSATPSRMRD